MREIASPLSGPFTTFGQTPIDIYKVGAYRPELAYSFYNDYYRRGRQPVNLLEAITHTRNGNATMTDSSGNIVWAPHNLLTYSEDFSNAAWTKANTTVTTNAAVAPDGTTTADTLTATAANGEARQSGTVVASDYTFSVWIKRKTGSGDVRIGNFTTGTQVVSVTSEWQLFTNTATLTAASHIFTVRCATSGDEVYIWGAHLYRSDLGGMADVPASERAFPTATKYVPTTDAARYLPRVNHHAYNGSQWVNKGLFVESEARTNLLPHSEDCSQSPTNVTFTDNVTTSPSGTVTADRMTGNGTSNSHYQYFNNVATGTHTQSIYVKYVDTQWVQLAHTSTINEYANFDIQNGVLGSRGSAVVGSTIEDIGGGWYRISATHTAASSALWGVALVTSGTDTWLASNTLSTSVDLWGWQLEAASTPSSYIPTNGASVTRPAESITIPAANLPWPNPVYVTGEELVTNGTFDSDTDWTKGTGWTIGSGVASSTTDGTLLTASVGSLVIGKVYAISFDIIAHTSGTVRFYTNGFVGIEGNSVSTVTGFFVAQQATVSFYSSAFVGSIDNISVKEINPLALSIQMKGEMTYADNSSYFETTFWRMLADGSNYLRVDLSTNAATTGRPYFKSMQGGTLDEISGPADDTYSPDINVPFNISSRHGSTFINGAVGGTSLTEDTTPTALPDLSATDLQLGYDMMGTISLFRIWGSDIGDDGISEAST